MKFTQEDLASDEVKCYLHDLARNELDPGEQLLEQLQAKLDANPPRHAIFMEQLRKMKG